MERHGDMRASAGEKGWAGEIPAQAEELSHKHCKAGRLPGQFEGLLRTLMVRYISTPICLQRSNVYNCFVLLEASNRV